MSVVTPTKPLYSYVTHPTTKEKYALVSCINQKIFESAISFQPHSDDVFAVSYPKCGTTWLINILYLLQNDGDPVPKNGNIEDTVGFLEFVGGEIVQERKVPRIIKSHLLYDYIPKKPKCKYVFVARNPKDCVVSYYHHTVGFDEYYKFADGKFDDFFEVFCAGECDFGNFFQMVPEWFEKSQTNKNIHFMLYEDMKADTKSELLKLCDFLGPSYRSLVEADDQKLLKKILSNSSFSAMKKEEEKYCLEERPANFPFVRKGVVGDWKNHMSRDQSQRINALLKEAGKQYPGFDKLWTKYNDLLEFDSI